MLHKTFVALLAVASIGLVSPTMALARGGGGGAKTVPGRLEAEFVGTRGAKNHGWPNMIAVRYRPAGTGALNLFRRCDARPLIHLHAGQKLVAAT